VEVGIDADDDLEEVVERDTDRESAAGEARVGEAEDLAQAEALQFAIDDDEGGQGHGGAAEVGVEHVELQGEAQGEDLGGQLTGGGHVDDIHAGRLEQPDLRVKVGADERLHRRERRELEVESERVADHQPFWEAVLEVGGDVRLQRHQVQHVGADQRPELAHPVDRAQVQVQVDQRV